MHFCLTNGCPSRGIVCYECCGSADMSTIERLKGIVDLIVHAGLIKRHGGFSKAFLPLSAGRRSDLSMSSHAHCIRGQLVVVGMRGHL